MSTPRCQKLIYKKPRFTGLPPKSRQCWNKAKYDTGELLCSRHTPKDKRSSEYLLYREPIGEVTDASS